MKELVSVIQSDYSMRASFLLVGLLVMLLVTVPTLAQTDVASWSEADRLSTFEGSADRAAMAADPFGGIHAIWPESSFEDPRPLMQYAQFDGTTWSPPVDIVVGGNLGAISFPSLTIDDNSFLHATWTTSQAGPVYYSTAPAWAADSAFAWSVPERLDFPAFQSEMQVSDDGTLHLVYSVYFDSPRGVFYTSSKDGGATWASPIQLDTDIPSQFAPQSIEFKADGQGGLHVLWLYSEPGESGIPGRWVRYAHSLDGGLSWSFPETIARAENAADTSLRAAGPVLAVSDETVMVVWAGSDTLPYRNYRVSADRGNTWGGARRLSEFGDLHGQARESLVVDHLGQIHYLGQIRYPKAIYHAVWNESGWSVPTVVYYIGPGDDIPLGRVHAHNVNAAFRAGNQLVVTFTDSPGEETMALYSTAATLDTLPTLSPSAIPTLQPLPSPTATAQSTATPEPTPSSLASVALSDNSAPPSGSGPQVGLLWGIVPVLILISVAAGLVRLRHR